MLPSGNLQPAAFLCGAFPSPKGFTLLPRAYEPDPGVLEVDLKVCDVLVVSQPKQGKMTAAGL